MPDDSDERFEQSVAEAAALDVDLMEGDGLAMRALYLQATSGDITRAAIPERMDAHTQRAYEAWTVMAGLSRREAKMRYTAIVDRLTGRP